MAKKTPMKTAKTAKTAAKAAPATRRAAASGQPAAKGKYQQAGAPWWKQFLLR